MARLQILELPTIYRDEGPDETPFILVIDQASETTIEAVGMGPKPDEPFNPIEGARRALGVSVAEQIGARAILVFEETVDVPANDSLPSSSQWELTIDGKPATWAPAKD